MKFASLRWFWASLGLVLGTLLVYWRVPGFDFVDFDDPLYLYENPFVQGGLTRESLAWSFSTNIGGFRMPITWISFLLDIEIGGFHPSVFHITNIVLHAANVLLLLWLLRRMTDAFWPSAIVAALFAVHPLHVESVAWIIERKDVLSLFFALATLLAYVRYVERRKTLAAPPLWAPWGSFAGVALLFSLGLAAKPMLITLPFAMVLLDYWPLKRDEGKGWGGLWRLLLEKLPLILLTLLALALTLQAAEAIEVKPLIPLELFPFSLRLTTSLTGYAAYLGLTFWPVDLAVFYPKDANPLTLGDPRLWQAIGSLILLIAITWWSARSVRERPWRLIGWLWFLGTLVPVIGLVAGGSQSMADRFVYLPHVGLFTALVWEGWDLTRRFAIPPRIWGAATAAALLALSVTAHQQTGYWKNDATLWPQAYRIGVNNALTSKQMGAQYEILGDLDRALLLYQDALRFNPSHDQARWRLGFVLIRLERYEDALEVFAEIERRDPGGEVSHRGRIMVALARDGLERAMPLFADYARQASSTPQEKSLEKTLFILGMRAGLKGVHYWADPLFRASFHAAPEKRQETCGNALDRLRHASLEWVAPGESPRGSILLTRQLLEKLCAETNPAAIS